jgi:hypothetical protein
MQLPFISRAAHKEIVALLREQIAELKAQLHPPVPEQPVQPERPAPQALDVFEVQKAATKARLRSIMRTQPSLIGREMQRVKIQEDSDNRRRAHGTHPAQVLFDAAKQAVS